MRSKPLEKNLPWAVVIRTEPRVAWDLAPSRVERIKLIKSGFSRCSSSPVRVRIKRLQRFSKVHMVGQDYTEEAVERP